ncbi:MAG TPA: type 1 glutamine amidotransferase, partial [Rhodocyclaceae bacterium]
MKPVAIFRHSPGEGPGYFATLLDQHSIPWRLFKLDEGEAPPAAAGDFSGLCFMGGHMSVNDDLPWIPPVLDLIRSAVKQDIPVLGH